MENKYFQGLEKEAVKYRSFDSFFASRKVYFHGTTSQFSKFDFSFRGSNTEYLNANWGFFFADDKKRAEEFIELSRSIDTKGEPRIVEAWLDIKKPLDLSLQGVLTKEGQAPIICKAITGKVHSAQESMRLLKEEFILLGEVDQFYEVIYDPDNKTLFQAAGYDGMISQMGRDGNQIVLETVAFCPEQIRTSAELKGIWDQRIGHYKDSRRNETKVSRGKKTSMGI